jgi:hypothetical protein
MPIHDRHQEHETPIHGDVGDIGCPDLIGTRDANIPQEMRVRFAELCKRGVGIDLAAQTAGSAHGPWRLANSPALRIALPNAYFDSLGIPRLTVSR